MFKNLFGIRKNLMIEDSKCIIAPVKGEIINIENVEDDLFSSKVMGDGVAIEPETELILAPANCKVVSAAENMKHAIGLKLSNDMEILIHIGIDTVSMNGDGFELLVKQDEIVKEGTPLVKFDKDKILKNGYKPTILVIVTNPGKCNIINYIREGQSDFRKSIIEWDNL